MPWDEENARRHVARTEELLSGLDTLPDGVAAARALECVEALVDLYGECLGRVMEHAASAEGGDALARRLADDELVGHLLLVHDLHPDPADVRVRRAVEQVRPQLQSLGGDAELLDLEDGTVRIRVQGGGRGCSSSPDALEQAVRDAVGGAVPEAERIDIETVQAPEPETLIPVDALFRDRTLSGRGAG
ncbi:NifU family protein [Streptomyces sp. NPDC051776]|uniref:NifU family protein n=1 Tax=Streptomyces sp. NPDC051776 TaxID=3155414 RepID=UPI00341517BE